MNKKNRVWFSSISGCLLLLLAVPVTSGQAKKSLSQLPDYFAYKITPGETEGIPTPRYSECRKVRDYWLKELGDLPGVKRSSSDSYPPGELEIVLRGDPKKEAPEWTLLIFKTRQSCLASHDMSPEP
jgi:hypothetical protein